MAARGTFFNARPDCLNQDIFETIEEVQNKATKYMWHYNNERPNITFGGITPNWKLHKQHNHSTFETLINGGLPCVLWRKLMKKKIETLQTERLILSELTLDHQQDYQDGFADYEVIRHMNGLVPWPYPNNGAREFMEQSVLPNQGKTLWTWGLFLKQNPNSLIGTITLRKSAVDNRGFWLAQKYWGKGYMTEAAEAVNAYAFEKLGFEKLLFTNAKGNKRSRRIKEKTGSTLVKILPMDAVDPQYTEAEHWELTKESWKNAKKHK